MMINREKLLWSRTPISVLNMVLRGHVVLAAASCVLFACGQEPDGSRDIALGGEQASFALTNLYTNPTFESGNTGWNSSGNAGTSNNAALARTGNYSGYIQAYDTSYAAIYQTLTLAPGDYTLRMYVKHEGDVRMFANDTTNSTVHNRVLLGDSSGYENQALSFTIPPGGNASVNVGIDCGANRTSGDWARIDDTSFSVTRMGPFGVKHGDDVTSAYLGQSTYDDLVTDLFEEREGWADQDNNEVIGGDGGTVYVVDHTADDGEEGSLRHALQSEDKLWIVFDTNFPNDAADFWIDPEEGSIEVKGFKTLDGRGGKYRMRHANSKAFPYKAIRPDANGEPGANITGYLYACRLDNGNYPGGDPTYHDDASGGKCKYDNDDDEWICKVSSDSGDSCSTLITFTNQKPLIINNINFMGHYSDWTTDSEGSKGISLTNSNKIWIHQSKFKEFADTAVEMYSEDDSNEFSGRVTVTRTHFKNLYQGASFRGNLVSFGLNYCEKVGTRCPKMLPNNSQGVGKGHAWNNLYNHWKDNKIQQASGDTEGAELFAEYNIYRSKKSSSNVFYTGDLDKLEEVGDSNDEGECKVKNAHAYQGSDLVITGHGSVSSKFRENSQDLVNRTKPTNTSGWENLYDDIVDNVGPQF